MYRLGTHTYGFQGHPELTPDLVRIWSRGWGDEWLAQVENVDIPKDVVKYSRDNKNKIVFAGLTLFDIWIDIALVETCPDQNPAEFENYTKNHWKIAKHKQQNSERITGPTWAHPSQL